MDPLVVRAPAKINLGLHILARRDDGYHEIETGMIGVKWYDTLTVTHAPALSLTCSDPSLPTNKSNLVMRAATRLKELTKYDGGASIHLDKQIPYGAGLGGGSSDAAATLNALCSLWNLEIPRQELSALAASIGSDVPFFLDPKPSIASGRGEYLKPLDTEAFNFPYTVVILASEQGISTAEAYGGSTPNNNNRPDIGSILTTTPVEEWQDLLVNDFTDVAFSKVKKLRSLEKYLRDAGASYVSLSGSGSAIYGLFSGPEKALRAGRLDDDSVRVWVGNAVTTD